jgi:hypothetical protein
LTGHPDSRLRAFLELSSALTDFNGVELLGTGVAGAYLRTLGEILPAAVLDDLLDGRDAAAILDDATLGPIARNVIVMWYCGTWSALPEDWRAAHGTSPLDVDHVVSPDAYVSGLQWVAAGAHAIAARPQGFGAWALPPEELAR